MLHAVIMAGGSGTRLWPLSRKSRPKQALKLIGDRTMFQHSVERLAPLFPPERIFVIANPEITELLRPQAPDLPEGNFIVEPVGRDSGPAVGLAAVHLLHKDPDAVMVTLAADHYIVDTTQFRASLAAAGQVATGGSIVTLGIKPASPDTRFGYIQLGAPQEIVDGFRVYESAGFKEKPDLQTALRFLEEGRYVWNSGMFMWRADRLMQEFAANLPESYAALARIRESLGTAQAAAVLAREWPRVKKISVDYGIMEHARNVCVIPVDIGWSDIGTWAALAQALAGDADGNRSDGNLVAVDSRNCYVRTDGRLVALVGLEDVAVIDTPDALLVCRTTQADEVKTVVNRLADEGRSAYL